MAPVGAVAVLLAAGGVSSTGVTFYKDVLPILQQRCQTCHRPGEIGPMALETYRQTRPWAKAIRDAVLSKRMPPWHADSRYGKFRNDLSLEPAEIDTLAAWADAGAPAGSPADAPAAKRFMTGWRIPPPDVVFELPEEIHIRASGAMDYEYLSVATGFTEDRWVEMAEVRPTNREVVHHAIVTVRAPVEGGYYRFGQYLAGYAPGMHPQVWQPGQARLIPAGSHLVFQMHYTPNGKAGVDRTRVGLVFAKRPPQSRIVAMRASNHWFSIPAGHGAYRVEAATVLSEPVSLVGMRPHMHLRGKSFEFRAVYPSGETEILLRVPRYDFNWQPYYYLARPVPLPPGTRIECTAYYDNSANNPRNPDPSVDVHWGEQSWEEMMIGWFDVAVDASATLSYRW